MALRSREHDAARRGLRRHSARAPPSPATGSIAALPGSIAAFPGPIAMASDSPARASIKRSASAGEIEGAAAASAKRARSAKAPVVILVVTVSDDYSQQCFKACVEARDDAEATTLERQCAGMRTRGVRNVLVRLGEEASDLDGIKDADVREVVKRLRYCDDIEVCEQMVEPLGECAVVRDIPEGYLIRVKSGANELSHYEPAVLPSGEWDDAHFVCVNLVEMAM